MTLFNVQRINSQLLEQYFHLFAYFIPSPDDKILNKSKVKKNNPFTMQWWLSTHLRKKPFENKVGKEENAGSQQNVIQTVKHVYKSGENIVEIVDNQYVPLFHQWFGKSSFLMWWKLRMGSKLVKYWFMTTINNLQAHLFSCQL